MVGCAGRHPGGSPGSASGTTPARPRTWPRPNASAASARKRERTIASIEDIRRLLEIAATDALSLDLSIAKVRAVIAVAAAAAKLLETGELEERIAALEDATGSGRTGEPPDGGLLGG